MDTDSLVVGMIITAVIAFFWRRSELKELNRSYAEIRSLWLQAAFEARVQQAGGSYFLAWREHGENFISFFESDEQATKAIAESAIPVNYARKWIATPNPWTGYWDERSIWEDKN
jgi:hypothetical protein